MTNPPNPRTLTVNMKAIGSRIRAMRVRLKFTQQQICDLLSLSRPTYIASEKGHRAFTAEEICNLATFFATEVSDIISPTESVVRDTPLATFAELVRMAAEVEAGEMSEGRFAKACKVDRFYARSLVTACEALGEFTLAQLKKHQTTDRTP